MQTNPFAHVDLPPNISNTTNGAVEDEAKNFYTREQLIEFLSWLKRSSNYKTKTYALFLLLAFSGTRKRKVKHLHLPGMTLTSRQTKFALII